jgi:hypothetical protein
MAAEANTSRCETVKYTIISLYAVLLSEQVAGSPPHSTGAHDLSLGTVGNPGSSAADSVLQSDRLAGFRGCVGGSQRQDSGIVQIRHPVNTDDTAEEPWDLTYVDATLAGHVRPPPM